MGPEKLFVHAGWNLVAQWGGGSQEYVWGLDLSGTQQGAGGVGGLLSVTEKPVAAPRQVYAISDANGNVMKLLGSETLATLAEYEYGPFGELIRMTGPRARVNPFRFSSKYQDDESGLLYYGYRYYDAALGRWLNRDPIEELGGVSLYAAARNELINGIDLLGLLDYYLGWEDPIIEADVGAGDWNTEPAELWETVLAADIKKVIPLIKEIYPNAGKGLEHYFANSKSKLRLDVVGLLRKVPSAKALYDYELSLAKAFAESVYASRFKISSGKASSGYVTKEEDKDWFYAMGGYAAWGKGIVTRCGKRLRMDFTYTIYDRYNWDTGKSVLIGYVKVTDAFMGSFHRKGLAREFDQGGEITRQYMWFQGEK